MRWKRCLAIGLLLGCGCCATGTQVLAAGLPKWARELADRPLPDRYADEDAVVLLDEWTIRLKEGARSGRHRVLTRVLTEDGVAYAVLPLARGAFDRFSGLKLWVAEASGKVTRHGEDQGLIFSAATRKILDETEFLVVSPPGLAPGAVVAAEYDWTSSPDIPQDVVPVQRSVPVVLARIELSLDGVSRARARISSSEGHQTVVVSDDKTWEFDDVPALRAPEQEGAPEPQRMKVAFDYAPAGDEYRFDDWSSTVGWLTDLFDQARKDRPLLASAVEELRSGEDDPVDRVGTFVRRLRYFSVAIGWGGYRPRPPELTLERGFGDCKDKSLLMVSLLRELGVAASPVLTTAPEDFHVDPVLSGPRQFNHCVVGVPWEGRDRRPGMAIVDDPDRGPIRIFDPTLSVESSEDISSRLEGAPGLPVDRQSNGLVRFPRTGSGENLLESEMIWNLDTEDGGRLETTYLMRGALRTSLEDENGRILSAEELRRVHYEGLSRSFPGFTDLEIREPETSPDGDRSYGSTFFHQAPTYEFDEFRVLRLLPVRVLATFPLPDAHDDQVLHQPYLATFRRVDEIVLDGQTVVQLPAALDVSSSVGSVEMAIEKRPGRLVVTREVRVASLQIAPEQREQILEIRKALRRANRASVVLRSPSRAALSGETAVGDD